MSNTQTSANVTPLMTCSQLEKLIEKTNNFSEKSTFRDEYMTEEAYEIYSPPFKVDPDREW